MKSSSFVSFLISLAIYVNSPSCCAKAQPSKEQLKAFHSAKTMLIMVDQSYGKAESVSLPFEDVTSRLFSEYGGLTGLEPSTTAKNYDVTLMIQADGEALGADYGKSHCYSGVSLKGTIGLQMQGISDYDKPFDAFITPPLILRGPCSVVPFGAPFDKAFREGFLPKVLELLYEIVGPNALLAALQDEDSDVQSGAAKVLGTIKDTSTVYPLITVLQDDSHYLKVRIEAAVVLGKIGDGRAVGPLVATLKLKDVDRPWLKDKFSKLHCEAAKALGNIKDTRAVEPLIAVLEDTSRAWYVSNEKAAATEALGKIKDPLAIEPLINALKSGESHIRSCVAEALKSITGQSLGEDYEAWSKWWLKRKK